MFGDGGPKTPPAAYMYPVVVNLDTGKVTVEKRTAGTYGKLRDSYDRIARENESRLQVAFDTGVVPAGVHRYYADAAAEIAKLERTPEPEAPSPTPYEPAPIVGNLNPRRNPMIIVPPGGFAGYAQQTLANQRALGSRVTSGTRKRKKAKKRATKRTAARRSKSTRKLKFGSPAWRKKYMKK